MDLATSVHIFVCLCLAGPALGQDQNLAPNWVQTLEANITSLREDVPVDKSLGFLLAVDPENATVEYLSLDDTFSVNRNTGEVKLARALDREQNEKISVTFTAQDAPDAGNLRRTAEVSFTVTVLDVNDVKPDFTNEGFTARVSEDAAVGTVVFDGLRVFDADRGINSEVDISCDAATQEGEGSTCSIFDVQATDVEEGRYNASIILKEPLDFETTRVYRIPLKAMDRGTGNLQTERTFLVEVTDINDTPPVIFNTPIQLTVNENLPVGTVVGEVRARDGDQGVRRPVTFALVAGDEAPVLSLTAPQLQDDGIYAANLTVAREIDRETLGPLLIYNLTVTEVVPAGESNDLSSSEAVIRVTIGDVRDNGPVFQPSEVVVTMDEWDGRATSVLVPDLNLRITNPDEAAAGTVELTIVGDSQGIFEVSPQFVTGDAAVNIQVVRPDLMDFEDKQIHSFRLVAREVNTTERMSASAVVTIQLSDVNDNSPVFKRDNYPADISVDLEVGETVVIVQATDKDSGENKAITYRLLGFPEGVFGINATTGRIFLVQSLASGAAREYIQYAEARDGGGRVDRAVVRISVTGTPDSGVYFPQQRYPTSVREGASTLNPAVNIQAENRGSGSITYTIVSGNTDDNAFVLSPTTGSLGITRPVSYDDADSGVFRIIVRASDGAEPPNTATATVDVTVQRTNLDTPTFDEETFTGEVSELAVAGTPVVTLLASDSDSGANGQLTYQQLESDTSNFRVDSSSGVISVAQDADLDIEKNGDRYVLVVGVADGGLPSKSATATVMISVRDANNKLPAFPRDIFVFAVPETAEVSTAIGTVSAFDPDSTAQLKYYVSAAEGETGAGQVVSNTRIDEWFEVGGTSGVIRTAAQLDRDIAATVTLTLQVSDLAAQSPPTQTATAKVVITISGFSSNDPYFAPPWTATNFRIDFSVPEELPANSQVFTLRAFHPNSVTPVTEYRKVPSTDPNNTFSVDPTTGVVRLLKHLDYESPSLVIKTLSFQAQAIISGDNNQRFVATANVYVRVLDINDNDPVFLQSPYRYNIRESAQPKTLLFIVAATDRDSGDFGQVSYSLEGRDARAFSVSPTTGRLTVGDNATFDRSLQSQYNFYVVASDNLAAPSYSARRRTPAPVIVTVLASNDAAPQFGEDVYQAWVSENLPVTGFILQVSATDMDEGENGRVTFSIMNGDNSDLFRMGGTSGIITPAGSLSGRARDEPYNITVRAQDAGVPPQETTVLVVVHISKSIGPDARLPYFTAPPYTDFLVSIPEEQSIDVVIQVQGVTEDGSQEPIRYRFRNSPPLPDHDAFNIDLNTGVISTRRPLDREQKAQYSLIVLLEYNSPNPAVITRRIIVDLEDTDDNTPSFGACRTPLQLPVRAHVAENELPGSFVAELEACDKDSAGNNVVYYEILGVSPGDLTYFKLANSTSGRIYTSRALDYETYSSYTLVLQARNQAVGGVAENITVIIEIDDQNDNGPDFSLVDQKLVYYVLTRTEWGTAIGQVAAGSLDTAQENKAVSYALTSTHFRGAEQDSVLVDPYEAFKMNPGSGVLRTDAADYLNFTAGHFTLDVAATDPYNRTSNTSATVYVVDNDALLRFVVEDDPEEFAARIPSLKRAIEEEVSFDVVFHNVEYAVISREYDFSRSVVCFHGVWPNMTVLTARHLEAFIVALKGWDEIRDTYSIETVELCSAGQVRQEISSLSTALWIILIVFAIIIFFLALICILLLCYYWLRSMRNLKRSRSYIALNANTMPSTLREYEWQEQTVDMGDKADALPASEVVVEGRYDLQ